MNWSRKEKVLREKRTIEATKKNLMGIAGKLGLIAQTLGHPIVRQGSGLMDQTFLDDPYEDFTGSEYAPTVSDQLGPEVWRDKINEASDDLVYDEGFVFDGLSRGMHLEIRYIHHKQRIDVSYKGFPVYKEVAGELYAYAPFPEWEDLIDRLYKVARDEAKRNKRFKEVQLGQEIEKQKTRFWERLRLRWGV